MRSSTDLAPIPPPSAAQDTIGAARLGHSWAFQRLFDELSRPLRSFADARGAQDPDGVVNDVLAEAFRALPGFRGDEGAFRGFVFHIARRRLIDEYRRTSRRVHSVPLPDGLDPPAAPDPMADVVAHHRALALVDMLTADQRDVILLRVVADLSIDDTAAALDKPVSAVKALQRRALATLRRKIDQQGVS